MGYPALYSVSAAWGDDDLPPPDPARAARYAAMTDEELLREVWLLAFEGTTQ